MGIFEQIENFFTVHQGIVSLATIAVPIVTVFVLFISLLHQTKQSNKIAKRESYQKLELASINLFQFELENSAKAWRLYNNKHYIANMEDGEETQEIHEIMNHVTQILNLFEMSIELHKVNVFDNKIFSTWMKWIHEIAQLNNFKKLWNRELCQHYTGELFCLITIAKMKKYEKFEDFVELLCYEEKFESIKLFFNRRKGKSCYKHECGYDCYKKLYRYKKLGEYLNYSDEQYEYNHFKRVFAKLVKRFRIKKQNKITRCFYEKD